MKEIVFVTGNKAKFKDAHRIFSEYEIKVTQKTLPIPEPRSWDVKEIATEKINFAKKYLDKPFIVDDSGFFIPSLGGFPATQVNFVLQTIGLEGLLKLLEGKDRYCEFRYALGYYNPDRKEPLIFEHKDKGIISKEVFGKTPKHVWSSLVQIFIPENFDKPLSDEKILEEFQKRWYKTSHFRKFAEWFVKSENNGIQINFRSKIKRADACSLFHVWFWYKCKEDN